MYPKNVTLSTQVSYVTAGYDPTYYWYTGSYYEGTYDFNRYSRSTPEIGGFFTLVLGLGFTIATIAAIGLGILLMKEKGMIGE
jgi:hypothetical protein